MNRHDDLHPVRIKKQWKNQKGITGIGIAAILVMVAFLALIAIRLFPIYVEHFSVTTHLENLGADQATKGKTDKEILSTLQKIFDIDDVKNVKKEHIFIERLSGGGMTIAIEYEVRTLGLGNVDLVAVFSDEVEIN